MNYIISKMSYNKKCFKEVEIFCLSTLTVVAETCDDQ